MHKSNGSACKTQIYDEYLRANISSVSFYCYEKELWLIVYTSLPGHDCRLYLYSSINTSNLPRNWSTADFCNIAMFLVHDDIASKTFAQKFMNDKHPCPHGIFQPVVFTISIYMGFQKSKSSPFSKSYITFYHIWHLWHS